MNFRASIKQIQMTLFFSLTSFLLLCKLSLLKRKKEKKVLFPNNTSRIEVDATIQLGNIQSSLNER